MTTEKLQHSKTNIVTSHALAVGCTLRRFVQPLKFVFDCCALRLLLLLVSVVIAQLVLMFSGLIALRRLQ